MVLPQIIYSNNSNDDKFDSVPEPVVGFDSLNDFLLANTQQESISQLVFQKINVPVRFKINSDGNISDVSGIYPQLQLTHEALRLTSLMPRWKPAYKNGKPVECEYIFNAVNFNYRKIKATKNYNIGVALLEQLQYKDALSSFNEAMKYYFGELNVFMNIGACYFGMHDTLRACGNWGMSALAGDTAAWRLINTWCDSMIINGNDTIRTNDMPEDSSGKKIYSIVEEMPKFPGGEGAMLEFIAKNIKYPGKARENGIQGRVYITFVINKDGEIKDARVLRGIGGGCDEAALHVINSMPRWKPGKQNGRPVQVQFNLPINFTIKVGK
jgi:TonB family protein